MTTMAGVLPSAGPGLVLQAVHGLNQTANGSAVNASAHPDNCGDNCEDDDVITYPAVQAFFCILYTTIFVLGVFGNVLVCYVVGRNRAMQTVTNFFITNLALSDILLCILAVPFTPLYSFVGRWVFGQVMCHLVTYAQGTSVYISTLTLTSIAIDRYFVIIYPFQPRMKQSTCLFIILGIWTFSLVVTVPYGLYMSFNDTYCEEAWPSENFRQIYSGVTTVLQFLVPLVVIAFAYICVSVRLSDHARLKPGCKSSRKEEADRERKRRTNRMLIAMVTVFGMSWMPLNVINLINDIHMSIGNWRYYNLVFFMVHALAMSSTCYNPFLYAWLNDNFRKEFKQLRGKRKDPSTSSPTTEAVSWTGACMGSSTNLGDLVTATYSTEDGSVEVHLPLEAVVLAANSSSPTSPVGVSPPGVSPGAASPTAGTAGTACTSIAVAPPERPLISISPESSPRNHAVVSRAMSGAAAGAAAAGPAPAMATAAVDNGANGSLRLLVTSGSATVA
ncbi:prolactin-releasing peptide receptor-like [Thrips palmi]|uniref:Prolactin-releasing peptide receptor-like n=1 Tax=Thrips palmi TaxID=161013 RepID=A0A6P9AB46_THRPL|nr:prolactin-releasing peptide receptor-like [Thrips palmi]